MKLMSKGNYLVLISLILLLPSVSAQTILIGAGNEGEVYTQEEDLLVNTTSSSVDADLKSYLQDLQASVDEREYLKAINEREKRREKKDLKIIKGLETTTKKQLLIIKDQNEKVGDLQDDLTTAKETMNTRIVQLESEASRQKYWTMLLLVACLVITVMVVEYIHAITRRKKLFFKLRKFRDEFPINPGVIVGNRE